MFFRYHETWISKIPKVCILLCLGLQICRSSMIGIDFNPDFNLDLIFKQVELQRINQFGNDKFVIEMALFCDKDFSGIFGYNKTKMLEYWHAILYDVQLRFETLQSTKFAFRVTSFQTFENLDEQPFIEAARMDSDSLSVIKAAFEFGEWIHSRVDKFPTFDIAVLATGSQPFNHTLGVAGFEKICKGNSIPGLWSSTTVFSVRSMDPVNTLAHEIAHVLGAPHDNNISYEAHQCGNHQQTVYIMSHNGGSKRHFFSQCSDKILSKRFKNLELDCLDDSERSTVSLIDTEKFEKSSFSFVEQCQVLTNDSSAYTNQSEANCSLVTCRYGTESNVSTEFLIPFNGSPCVHKTGAQGACFWGSCIRPGFLLQNSFSGKCITGYIDLTTKLPKLTVSRCSNLPKHPLNLIRLYNTAQNGMFLMKIFWSIENDAEVKCLTLYNTNEIHWIPGFETCSPLLGWDIKPRRSADGNNELVLFHRKAEMCLEVNKETEELFGTKDCSMMNKRTGWKLSLANGTDLTFENFENLIELVKPKKQNIKWYVTALVFFLLLVVLLGIVALLAYVVKLCYNFGKHLVPKLNVRRRSAHIL